MNHPSPVEWQIVGDTLCASGESPFWHPREERLYWMDASLKRIWRHHLPSGRAELWDLPRSITGLAPCRSGGLLIVMEDGIYHSAAWQDVPAPMASLPPSKTPRSLRGGRCDPWGRLWLVSQPTATGSLPQSGALHCLPARKTVRPALHEVRSGLPEGDGWAWSPDGRMMYWCMPHRQEVEQAGMSMPGSWPPELGMPMALANLKGHAGHPRSGAMDRAGRYWVAMTDGGSILCIDSRGKIADHIAAPTPGPTGLCFGGADMKTLFITTARAHRSASELSAYPRSGGVFAWRTESPGLPAPVYWD